MAKLTLLAASMALVLTACATTPTSSLPEPPAYPSDEWLATNVAVYVERAESMPTTANKRVANDLVALRDRRERENAKMSQVDRELTLAWGNRGRAGAAMRQPAYIHVLGDSLNARYDMDSEQFTEAGGSPFGDQQNSGSSDRNWITAGASMYELQRWERFCDQGRGMDEPDWRFVTEAGGRNHVPEILTVGCTPPDHDLNDYLQAWTSFCELEDTSPAQRQIVRNSTRPRTVVNPCKALL